MKFIILLIGLFLSGWVSFTVYPTLNTVTTGLKEYYISSQVTLKKAGTTIDKVTSTTAYQEIAKMFGIEQAKEAVKTPDSGNKAAIEKLFDYALGLKNIDDQLFTSTDDIFFHHDFHSEISDVSKELLKIQIEEKCKFTRDCLQKADVIVITFATSWVYQHVEYQNIVSNCHKKPSLIFEKKLFSARLLSRSKRFLRM